MHVKHDATHTHTKNLWNKIWRAISYAFFSEPRFHFSMWWMFKKGGIFTAKHTHTHTDRQTIIFNKSVGRRAKNIQFNHHYYSKFPGVWVSFLVHRRNGSNFGNHHFIVCNISTLLSPSSRLQASFFTHSHSSWYADEWQALARFFSPLLLWGTVSAVFMRLLNKKYSHLNISLFANGKINSPELHIILYIWRFYFITCIGT